MYDLFISFKSENCAYAMAMRNELLEIDSKLEVFMSEVSLDKIGNSDYSKTIEQAIQSAKNMVVVSDSLEYINSKWVAYEWRLFRHHQLNDKMNFYNNLVLAIRDINPHMLPTTLQLCECIDIADAKRLYQYIKDTDSSRYNNLVLKGFNKIYSLLEIIGWKDSLFFSAQKFSEYEKSLASELAAVTVLSHTLSFDSPGGALFSAVAENLSRGTTYNYIFLDASHAYGNLRKIYYGHSEENRKRLLLETAQDTFWALGTYSTVTIYEFKNQRKSEGYLRILVDTVSGIEQPVFVKMSEPFVDMLWNNIESYRAKKLIKHFSFS